MDFKNASELLALCQQQQLPISEIMRRRECELGETTRDEVTHRMATVGEIAPTQEFYTFDAKYKDESSRLYIPAHITPEQLETVRQDALRVYTALGCRGLSRVDFFVTHDGGEVVFNELNAIPGFTSISMYPKLFDYEGIHYAELLDRLIALALEEHHG